MHENEGFKFEVLELLCRILVERSANALQRKHFRNPDQAVGCCQEACQEIIDLVASIIRHPCSNRWKRMAHLC